MEIDGKKEARVVVSFKDEPKSKSSEAATFALKA